MNDSLEKPRKNEWRWLKRLLGAAVFGIALVIILKLVCWLIGECPFWIKEVEQAFVRWITGAF